MNIGEVTSSSIKKIIGNEYANKGYIFNIYDYLLDLSNLELCFSHEKSMI